MKVTPEIRVLAEHSAKAASGTGTYRRGICQPCDIRTGKPDRRGSFSFNSVSGFYQCFKCGLTGRVAGYDEADFEPEVVQDRPVMEPPEGFYELCRGDGATSMSLDPARAYLRSRGLTSEALWKEAHLGACIAGWFASRVVVPVLSPDDVWLGFVARAWTKKADVPYLYPKGMARRDILYNHKTLLREGPPVFVVEGVMDALALWPDAVAVLGKPTDPQVWALADSPRPIAVCLDGDAWQEGEALALRLRLEGQRAGSIRLPPTKDPDEMEVQWLREEARRVIE
jgi:DNA primase